MKTEVPRRTYLITPAPDGWRIVVSRDGRVDGEPVVACTRAEACRLARSLAGSGAVGFIKEECPHEE